MGRHARSSASTSLPRCNLDPHDKKQPLYNQSSNPKLSAQSHQNINGPHLFEAAHSIVDFKLFEDGADPTTRQLTAGGIGREGGLNVLKRDVGDPVDGIGRDTDEAATAEVGLG
jgi:hypothetical protein